jgi:hypothetical protein
MNTETVEKDKTLTTADFAGAPGQAQAQRDVNRTATAAEAAADNRRQQLQEGDEQLAALFASDVAGNFRSRWDAVQIGFVDDPKQAVRQADELVAQVMKTLAESFSSERARIESQLDQPDSTSTEDLRMALRRYRSFFQRLLSL